jgi:hypothetical protein
MCIEKTIMRNEKAYQLSIDSEGEEIEVRLKGELMGKILLSKRLDSYRSEIEFFHITNLSLDNCSGIGIGTECIELHKETFSTNITAGSNNGLKDEDGSHLTGDGVKFIAKMRSKGLVLPEQ